MKASLSPWLLPLLAVCLSALPCPASAQDTVVLTNGQSREGKIVGVSNGNIKIKIGPAETSLPLAQVKSVSMQPPEGYQQALAAWQARDSRKALTLLNPLVTAFIGLPAPWAERASSTLAEIYLAENQLAEAEAALTAFEKAYPQSTQRLNLARATIALSKNDLATVKAKVAPIVAEAQGVKLAGPEKSAAYGQAFYLMGRVHEAEGNFPEALQDYLSTVTIFYEDSAAVAKARDRADILIKEKQAVVP